MEVIDTHLNGLFLMTQAALAVMKRGGTIVNNLSIAAERIFPPDQRPTTHRSTGLGFNEYVAGRVASKWNSGDRADARATDTAIWDTLWPKAPRRK